LNLLLLTILPIGLGLIAALISTYVEYRSGIGRFSGRRGRITFPLTYKAQVAELERLFRLEGDAHSSNNPSGASSIGSESAKEAAKQ
jgi:hypothetical protein